MAAQGRWADLVRAQGTTAEERNRGSFSQRIQSSSDETPREKSNLVAGSGICKNDNTFDESTLPDSGSTDSASDSSSTSTQVAPPAVSTDDSARAQEQDAMVSPQRESIADRAHTVSSNVPAIAEAQAATSAGATAPAQQALMPHPSGTGMFVPVAEYRAIIVDMLRAQLEYYFSIENLARDLYLRTLMDPDGFVPLSSLSRFNRVRVMLLDAAVLTDACIVSSMLQLSNDGSSVRKADDHSRWVLTGVPPDQLPHNGAAQRIRSRIEDWALRNAHELRPETKMTRSGVLMPPPPQPTPSAKAQQHAAMWASGRHHDHALSNEQINRLVVVAPTHKELESNDPLACGSSTEVSWFFEGQLNDAGSSKLSGSFNSVAGNSNQADVHAAAHAAAAASAAQAAVLATSGHDGNVDLDNLSRLKTHSEATAIHRHASAPTASGTDALRLMERSLGKQNINSSCHRIDETVKQKQRQHASKALLEEHGFTHERYSDFFERCIAERAREGIGCSASMRVMYNFWKRFLQRSGHWSNAMFNVFKLHAYEDMEVAGSHDGVKEMARCLASALLDRGFTEMLYSELESVALKDAQAGCECCLEELVRFHSSHALPFDIPMDSQLAQLCSNRNITEVPASHTSYTYAPFLME